jgi:hypothetical protein
MLPIVPHATRIKAATLAAVLITTCAACGSTTSASAAPISPFSELPGFTVTEVGPTDVDPAVASAQFDDLAAGIVSQNGVPMLRVLAGQVKSGNGDAFVHSYLETLSTQTGDGVGLPSETQRLGNDVVTHFNIPLTAEGYTYAAGPTVVIAYVAPGSPPATVEDGLTKILANL